MNSCCNGHISKDEARSLLAAKGISRTKSKVNLLLAISKSKSPVSVSELQQKLKESCDISTVFRALTQFKDHSLVREVNLGEGFCRFEIASLDEDKSHHHHHVRCRKCGVIKMIEDCDISKFQKAISKLGFKQMEHSLEFTALCSNCH